MKITITVSIKDKGIFKMLEENSNISYVETDNFDGLSELIRAIVTLTASTIPFILKVIREQKDEKKYVTISYKGIEIKAESEEQIEEILRRLIQSENNEKIEEENDVE